MKHKYGGFVPFEKHFDLYSTREWFKCKKCGGLFEAHGNPEFYHKCKEKIMREDEIDYTPSKSLPDEDSGLFKYGDKLITLGEMFQNPETKLSDLVGACYELGLIVSFKIEPDHTKSIELPSEK